MPVITSPENEKRSNYHCWHPRWQPYPRSNLFPLPLPPLRATVSDFAALGAEGADESGRCVFITAVPNTKLCAWGDAVPGRDARARQR
jgi:hypothetical protein